MKASTESLISSGIKTNIAIQEDNLAMLESCNKLCDVAREVEIFNKIKSIAQSEDFDAITYNALNALHGFCTKLGIKANEQLQMSVGDRRAAICNAIDAYTEKNVQKIKSALTHMLDASIQDIDKVTEFKHVNEFKTTTVVPIYSAVAVENLCVNFREIIQTISFAANTDVNTSYEDLRNKIKDQLSDKLAMVHTTISQEGYVSIDVPQPNVQTCGKAGATTDNALQRMGSYMNAIAYEQLTERLGKFKLNLGRQLKQINKLEDTVRRSHLIAQLIMAVKGSVRLMKDYHTATLNELGC